MGGGDGARDEAREEEGEGARDEAADETADGGAGEAALEVAREEAGDKRRTGRFGIGRRKSSAR